MIPHIHDKLAAHMSAAAREMRRRAKHGLFDGRVGTETDRYMRHCTVDDPVTRMRIIFTRDTGHHSSGWMKNPDYERCWHLSLSPLPAPSSPYLASLQLAEFDLKTRKLWVEAFYGNDLTYVWYESPKTRVGKTLSVQHYRLFCNDRWEPIIPRGEVYSTEFTELGWRSASQVFEEEGRVIESVVDPT